MSKNNDSTIYVDMGGVSELFKGEEEFDKGVIDRGKQLQKHCIQRAKEIYGENLPIHIKDRIEEELVQIERAGDNVAATFLAAVEMFQAPCFQGPNRYIRGFRRALGASFVAYLCDITPFNPLELPENLTMHPVCFCGKMYLPMYINIGTKTKKEFMENNTDYEIPEGVELYNTINLELLEELQRRTEDIYICSGYEKEDDGFTSDMWGFLRTEDIKFLPEFRDHSLAQQIINNAPDLNIAALTKIIGLLHGSGTWFDNAEYLTKKYDNWLEKAISCQEDVYEYLMAHQVPHTSALDITEKVRHGNKSLSEEEMKILREYHCEDWFIESVRKIRYLFSRAQTLCYAMETKRLIYYFNKYRRLYIKIFENVYGIKAARWAEWGIHKNRKRP